MTCRKNTPKPLPTQERLRELLDYDPDTGVFRWRISQSRKVKMGNVAGIILDSGYRQIGVNGVNYYAHRLVFMWMNGACPDCVDHIDRNRANNAWRNLRPATRSQNQVNIGIAKNNTSGVKGVHWDARRKKWRARIRIDGKLKSFGSFTDITEAANAYSIAATAHFGEFSCAATN